MIKYNKILKNAFNFKKLIIFCEKNIVLDTVMSEESYLETYSFVQLSFVELRICGTLESLYSCSGLINQTRNQIVKMC